MPVCLTAFTPFYLRGAHVEMATKGVDLSETNISLAVPSTARIDSIQHTGLIENNPQYRHKRSNKVLKPFRSDLFFS